MTIYRNGKTTALGRIGRTGKFIALLVAVAAAFPVQAAAQGAGMIATQACYYYDWTGETYCFVGLVAGDGSGNVVISADGINPALSRDGTKIAFLGYSQGGLFVYNFMDGSLVTVRNSAPNWSQLAWSPDGTKLAFSEYELYVMNADGSNVVQLTNNVGFRGGRPSWSTDGTIAFDCEIQIGNPDICTIKPDGTSFSRLTVDPAPDSAAAFSPDGLSIAFLTGRYGGSQIAVMNSDGTGVTRVGASSEPAWSPDGTRIAFVQFVPSGYEGACPASGDCPGGHLSIFTMNRDGSDPRQIGYGETASWGLSPRPFAQWESRGCNGLNCTLDGSRSWGGRSPIMSYSWDFGDGTTGSGSTVSHAYPASGTYNVKLTVTDAAGITGTVSQVLDVINNVWPTARFTFACIGWRCTVDGSGSSDPDGFIASYDWIWGDGDSIGYAPAIMAHTYRTAGPFTVTLYVNDNRGARVSQQQVVNLPANTPPVASFTASCTGLTCTFDGHGSSDADGTIASYAWSFGDATTGSGVTASHTYAAAGTYAVSLIVTDNGGATGVRTGSVTVSQPAMHIGDLDATRTNQQNAWTALVTITVHSNNHGPVANTTVSGSWSIGGSASCTTDSSGQCLVSRSAIPKSTKNATFTIVNATNPAFLYRSVDNHDPDGDSNGTSITVNNP